MRYKVTQKRNPSISLVVSEQEAEMYKTHPALKRKYHIKVVEEDTPPEAKKPTQKAKRGRPKKS